jgi:hypothetical protein
LGARDKEMKTQFSFYFFGEYFGLHFLSLALIQQLI